MVNHPVLKAYKVIIPALFMLSSCAGDKTSAPDSDTVFADFYIRYLAPEQEFKAYASFVEGTPVSEGISKTFPGGVKFMGQVMDPRRLNNEALRYQYSGKKSYSRDLSFSFLETNGTQQLFAATMENIDTFSISGDASKSKGLHLMLSGADLERDETLLLLFTDALSKAYTLQANGPLPASDIFFTPEQMGHLPVGKLELYLVRKKMLEGLRDNFDYRFAIEYYSDVLTVTMGE